MHTDAQELTIRDLHTNRALVFCQPVKPDEVCLQFEGLNASITIDSGELLLVAQMLAAEWQPDREAIKVALNNWLNGLLTLDPLLEQLRSLFIVAWRKRDELDVEHSTLNVQRSTANTRMHRVIMEIIRERARQMELLAKGDILFDCADPNVYPDCKLRVQTEELGEVAKAIDLLEAARAKLPGQIRPETIDFLREDLRRECIQLAAVSTAFAESLTEMENVEA